MLLFFFKQKTAYEMRISDWSSDVCSSDLSAPRARPASEGGQAGVVRVERRVQRAGQLLQHRRDLRLDELGDGRLDAEAVVQQDRAHLAPDPDRKSVV